MSTVVPYKDSVNTKKEQVAQMFNNISGKYDLLNHLLSAGIDKRWRKTAVAILKKEKPSIVLDVATGTGDFAIAALQAGPSKVIGVDISEQMLEVGKQKIKTKKLEDKIELLKGDSENLPFSDNYFDAVIVSFGVRNFENLEKGLNNMYRVLKKDGIVIILEFSKPKGWFISRLYNFYFKYILPFVGRLISKDKAAYTYLPASVEAFPEGDKFLSILNKVGFKTTACKNLTFGICSIYTGKK